MTELPEKVIVSNGCDDCLFLHFSNETEDEVCKLNKELYCSHFAIEDLRHPDCPLLTHSIKVVKVGEKPANKWSDEDMINEFNAASWNDISSESLTTEQWLEQYKVVKNG